MLRSTYFSQNYASIIHQGLLVASYVARDNLPLPPSSQHFPLHALASGNMLLLVWDLAVYAWADVIASIVIYDNILVKFKPRSGTAIAMTNLLLAIHFFSHFDFITSCVQLKYRWYTSIWSINYSYMQSCVCIHSSYTNFTKPHTPQCLFSIIQAQIKRERQIVPSYIASYKDKEEVTRLSEEQPELKVWEGV